MVIGPMFKLQLNIHSLEIFKFLKLEEKARLDKLHLTSWVWISKRLFTLLNFILNVMDLVIVFVHIAILGHQIANI